VAKLLRGTGKLALQRGGELTAAQRSGGTAEQDVRWARVLEVVLVDERRRGGRGCTYRAAAVT